MKISDLLAVFIKTKKAERTTMAARDVNEYPKNFLQKNHCLLTLLLLH